VVGSKPGLSRMLFPHGALNYKVPKTIPIDHAMFIEPLSCSIHPAERGDIQYQDVVVIAGCGPLGLGMIAAAKLKGPAMSERRRLKLSGCRRTQLRARCWAKEETASLFFG
jgi:hypothetical protein